MTGLKIERRYKRNSNSSALIKGTIEKVVYGEDVVIKDKTYLCKIAANDAVILYLKRD